jgi:hypothetical protein
VKVAASFVADPKSFELVQPGEGAFNHPTHLAQPGAVGDAASGDHRLDAAPPQQSAVFVEVVASICVQAPGLAPGPSAQSADRWDRVQQLQELSDVVSVAAGERDAERGSVAIDDQMMFGAGTGAVDWRGADLIPPLSARTCDPSTAQSSRSSSSARRSSVSNAA